MAMGDRLPASAERLIRLDEGFTAHTIADFLARQRGVPAGRVRLDDGRIVPEGEDADDECD